MAIYIDGDVMYIPRPFKIIVHFSLITQTYLTLAMFLEKNILSSKKVVSGYICMENLINEINLMF